MDCSWVQYQFRGLKIDTKLIVTSEIWIILTQNIDETTDTTLTWCMIYSL